MLFQDCKFHLKPSPIRYARCVRVRVPTSFLFLAILTLSYSAFYAILCMGRQGIRHTWTGRLPPARLPSLGVPFEAIAVVKCRVCGTTYVTNTVYCAECGAYLLDKEELETDPIDLSQIPWMGRAPVAQPREVDLPGAPPRTIRLIIGRGVRRRELEVSLIRPVRLGRNDPTQNIFPEVDLTPDLALEHAVSREHAAIFGRGSDVMVEDLGSTNGTLLNGVRLDPYIPETLEDGDQLQLGKLLIEVKLR